MHHCVSIDAVTNHNSTAGSEYQDPEKAFASVSYRPFRLELGSNESVISHDSTTDPSFVTAILLSQ